MARHRRARSSPGPVDGVTAAPAPAVAGHVLHRVSTRSLTRCTFRQALCCSSRSLPARRGCVGARPGAGVSEWRRSARPGRTARWPPAPCSAAPDPSWSRRSWSRWMKSMSTPRTRRAVRVVFGHRREVDRLPLLEPRPPPRPPDVLVSRLEWSMSRRRRRCRRT